MAIETSIEINESVNNIIKETTSAVPIGNINNMRADISESNLTADALTTIQTVVQFPQLLKNGTEFNRYYKAGKVHSATYVYYDDANVKHEAELQNCLTELEDENNAELLINSANIARTAVVATTDTSENEPSNNYNTTSYIMATYSVMPTTETNGITSGTVYRISSETGPNSISYSSSDNVLNRQSTDNYNTDKNQFFQISYLGSGKYAIIPIVATTKRLAKSGSNVIVSTASSSTTQQWYIIQLGGVYRFVNVYSEEMISAGANYSVILSESNSSTSGVWMTNEIKRQLNVELLVQQTTSTCMSACGTMIVRYLGANISETDFKECSDEYAEAEYQRALEKELEQAEEENREPNEVTRPNHTYVYIVKYSINNFIPTNATTGDKIANYVYIKYTNTTTSQNNFTNKIIENINEGHPVLVQSDTTNCSYFNYNSRHALLITGYYYDASINDYMVVVNDPHYQYAQTLHIPMSEMFACCIRHSGYIICSE